MHLGHEGRRVLGCLVEKAMATPGQYPLSINALITASNQRTGRDPVVDFVEADVRAGLDDCKDHDLVRAEYARGSRTPKYAHRLEEQLDLDDPQMAVLALLLLRGPQTVGELRSRTERLHPFGDLSEVQAALEALAGNRFSALAEAVPRRPGQKEGRWRHLLSGAATAEHDQAEPADAVPPAAAGGGRGADLDRVAVLETAISELTARVSDLEGRLDRAGA
jgi:uncharacterized protein YceH (UPF0502 family)